MKIIVSIKLLETTTHFILGILYNSLDNEIINKKIPQGKIPEKVLNICFRTFRYISLYNYDLRQESFANKRFPCKKYCYNNKY